MENSSFKQAFTSGISWSFLSRVFRQIFDFLATVFLARLLSPSDFGIFGLAMLFIGLLNLIYDLGLGSALVQRKEVTWEHESSVFWFGIFLGIFFAVLCILAAPVISAFFGQKEIASLIVVIGLQYLLVSLVIVHRAKLGRELKFGKLAVIDGVVTASYAISAIIFAITGFGVWSIVWGSFVANILGLIVTFAVVPFVPKIYLSLHKIWELFPFGSGVVGWKSFDYVGENIDNFFVGTFLGPSALGVYAFAYNLATFAQRRLVTVISEVVFPTFSKLQEDTQRAGEAYLKLLSYLTFFITPLIFGMFILAPEFVTLVYGNKWSGVVLPLRILLAGGYVTVLWSLVPTLLLSQGKSFYSFLFSLIRVLFLATLIPLSLSWGVAGVATVVTVYGFVLLPFFQVKACRLLGISFLQVVKIVSLGLTAGVVMTLFISLFMSFASFSRLINFVLAVLLGGAVYLLMVKILQPMFYSNLLAFVKTVRGGNR